MARVHEYVIVSPDGTCGVTKSNGPICFQQSRQEVGGHFESFDPLLGDRYTAQINEEGSRGKLQPNKAFDGVSGNVLIGRVHGTEVWGLTPEQREDVVSRIRLKVEAMGNAA